MTMKSMHLDIVSAERSLYAGDVTMLFATTELGEVGIAPGHTQLLAALKPGDIRAQFADGHEQVFYCSGGFLEVQPASVTVLSDTAVRAEDLDEAAILEAKQAAEASLETRQDQLEYARALAELAETTAQLQTLAKWRKKHRV
jgi:F-type H+-transporting ATPase subunit epsilon